MEISPDLGLEVSLFPWGRGGGGGRVCLLARGLTGGSRWELEEGCVPPALSPAKATFLGSRPWDAPFA